MNYVILRVASNLCFKTFFETEKEALDELKRLKQWNVNAIVAENKV